MDTKNREVKALVKAMDSFKLEEGWIITENYDSVETVDNKKIICKPLWQWLLER